MNTEFGIICYAIFSKQFTLLKRIGPFIFPSNYLLKIHHPYNKGVTLRFPIRLGEKVK